MMGGIRTKKKILWCCPPSDVDFEIHLICLFKRHPKLIPIFSEKFLEIPGELEGKFDYTGLEIPGYVKVKSESHCAGMKALSGMSN